jgi:hypothetical protein
MAAEQSATPTTAPEEALTMRTLLARSIALMKPVTWFPPSFAFIRGTSPPMLPIFDGVTVADSPQAPLMAGPDSGAGRCASHQRILRS